MKANERKESVVQREENILHYWTGGNTFKQ